MIRVFIGAAIILAAVGTGLVVRGVVLTTNALRRKKADHTFESQQLVGLRPDVFRSGDLLWPTPIYATGRIFNKGPGTEVHSGYHSTPNDQLAASVRFAEAAEGNC